MKFAISFDTLKKMKNNNISERLTQFLNADCLEITLDENKEPFLHIPAEQQESIPPEWKNRWTIRKDEVEKMNGDLKTFERFCELFRAKELEIFFENNEPVARLPKESLVSSLSR